MRDETTFDLTDMERKDRWKYYISSYTRIEPTEGVPLDRIRKSVLTRNLPSTDNESESGYPQQMRKPLSYSEDLSLRVCVNTYRMTYKAGTSEYFVYSDGKKKAELMQAATERRNTRFEEKLVKSNRLMKDKSEEAAAKVNEDFKKWMYEGVVPGTN